MQQVRSARPRAPSLRRGEETACSPPLPGPGACRRLRPFGELRRVSVPSVRRGKSCWGRFCPARPRAPVLPLCPCRSPAPALPPCAAAAAAAPAAAARGRAGPARAAPAACGRCGGRAGCERRRRAARAAKGCGGRGGGRREQGEVSGSRSPTATSSPRRGQRRCKLRTAACPAAPRGRGREGRQSGAAEGAGLGARGAGGHSLSLSSAPPREAAVQWSSFCCRR